MAEKNVIEKLNNKHSTILNELDQFIAKLSPYNASLKECIKVDTEGNITCIKLSNCNLNEIPEVIKKLDTIEELYLNKNFIHEIPSFILQLENLRELDLSSNRISKIPDFFKDLKALKCINLSSNNISDLSDTFFELINLKHLNISHNPLKKLPKNLFNLINLRHLNLSYLGLKKIPEDISKLINLNILNLDGNENLEILNHLKELKSLKVLKLNFCGNRWYRSLAEDNTLNEPWSHITEFPTFICYLDSLEELSFSDTCITTIPRQISNLKKLKILDLSYNKIEFLPDSICKLESLREVSLKGNMLEELPHEIGNLKHLEHLNLSYNFLTNLPKSLENLCDLNYFKIKKNWLPKRISQGFKAQAVKNKGKKFDILMKIALECEVDQIKKSELKYLIEHDIYSSRGVDYTLIDNVITIEKKISKNKILPFLYAGFIVILGIFILTIFRNYFYSLIPSVYILLFSFSLILNFFIGIAIIPAISKYFYFASETTFKLIRFEKFRKIIYRGFEIFILGYLIWVIRALIKNIFSIELIFMVDFLFENYIPNWILNILRLLGYYDQISLLENIDLFFGGIFLKLFSISLVFWAFYRNGISHINRIAFEHEDNKNSKVFLILGIAGAIIISIMDYSSLSPFNSTIYYIGALIGTCLFLKNKYKDNLRIFYYYVSFLPIGVILVWISTLWNITFGLFLTLGLMIIFYLIRKRL